jgi:magnesium chelatase family protein
MSLATIVSRAQNGLAADEVRIEVHLASGLPALNLVGLPEAAVREARDRVKAALQTCGFQFPNRKVTVNMAPADLPKEGGRFDLPIALGILEASGQLPEGCLQGVEVLGELSLTGEIRAVRGVLPAALRCGQAGRKLLVPESNAIEARRASDTPIYAASHLQALCEALHGKGLVRHSQPLPAHDALLPSHPDMADVRGQQQARRALEVAAAGGHSLLMLGPPGSGKSMLAARLPGLLPALTDTEALDVATIASISPQGFAAQDWGKRPFRHPHHTASGVALVGGGGNPRPGEITLAHGGVLFLDELPEFDRSVLEVLREPLETGKINISRAARQVEYPAGFQLMAAMNPCPCGYLGEVRCRCTPDQIQRYRGKISGPLLDRIDLQLVVPKVENEALLAGLAAESSADIRKRVEKARKIQLKRQGKVNAQLDVAEIEQHCRPDATGLALLGTAMSRLNLSARAYHRILKVARTLADMAGAEHITSPHIAEAVRYRDLDRG